MTLGSFWDDFGIILGSKINRILGPVKKIVFPEPSKIDFFNRLPKAGAGRGIFLTGFNHYQWPTHPSLISLFATSPGRGRHSTSGAMSLRVFTRASAATWHHEKDGHKVRYVEFVALARLVHKTRQQGSRGPTRTWVQLQSRQRQPPDATIERNGRSLEIQPSLP